MQYLNKVIHHPKYNVIPQGEKLTVGIPRYLWGQPKDGSLHSMVGSDRESCEGDHGRLVSVTMTSEPWCLGENL